VWNLTKLGCVEKMQQHKVSHTQQYKVIIFGTIDGPKIACYLRLKKYGRLFISFEFYDSVACCITIYQL